jgi:hypothetical protein
MRLLVTTTSTKSTSMTQSETHLQDLAFATSEICCENSSPGYLVWRSGMAGDLPSKLTIITTLVPRSHIFCAPVNSLSAAIALCINCAHHGAIL